MKNIVFLLTFFATHSPAFADPIWTESLREYGLKMITEAKHRHPENAQLNRLGYALQEAKLKVIQDSLIDSSLMTGYYAYSTVENQKIHVSRLLSEMKIEIAAETLVHEAGHLIGLDECATDELSAFVAKNSRSSHGLMLSTNLKECPEVMKSTCGMPVLFDRKIADIDLTQLKPRELKRMARNVFVTPKNAILQFFIVQRLQEWIGGDACSAQYPDDFNRKLQISYDQFFQKKGFAPSILYLNSARAELQNRIAQAAGQRGRSSNQ